MRHIFLYGPPGSGKSSIGKLLAASLNMPFLDLDTEIEKTVGQSISHIMADQGEIAFRKLESVTLERVAVGPASVVALGGGALLRDTNRICAESIGQVVLLEADMPTLLARMQNEPSQRPLLAGRMDQKLQALLEQRNSHYDSFRLRITTTKLELETLVWNIQQLLGCFHVRGMGDGYDVIVQPGGLGQIGDMLKESDFTGTIAVVADTNVSKIYGQQVQGSLQAAGFNTHLLTFPFGEQHKTLETVSYLWRGFLEAELDRRSMVVALGGGVTGDLSGFAASAFMRGIPWVGLPTSLLAMADSSLGGKTGCDLPEGKNLIGAFHSPSLVLSDPNVLSTLPEEELRSGLAEVVKNAVIADRTLFELCIQGYDAVKANLPEIIRRAMAVKVKYIEVDPFERGLRAALNFGHTVGHAIETLSGYRLRHGEAVSIGMMAEARLAERLNLANAGLSRTIAGALMGLGLPLEIPSNLPKTGILRVMQFDKKKDFGAVRFALPVAIGNVRVGVEVENLELLFTEV